MKTFQLSNCKCQPDKMRGEFLGVRYRQVVRN